MLKYYLPWRAALTGQYRFYNDTWGINAHTGELEYTHPWQNRWVFSGSYRFYTQNSADFFSDLFPRRRRAELHGARQGNTRRSARTPLAWASRTNSR